MGEEGRWDRRRRIVLLLMTTMMMNTVNNVILHYQHTELSHHPHRTDDRTRLRPFSMVILLMGRCRGQEQLEQVLIVICHYGWGDKGLVDIVIDRITELMDVDESNTQQTPAYELHSHIYNHHTDSAIINSIVS